MNDVLEQVRTLIDDDTKTIKQLRYQVGQCEQLITALETENQRLVDQLGHLVQKLNTDDMTGLANRYHLESSFNTLLSQPQCHQLSLVFIDMNKLKAVNDQYGHLVGDQAICHLATLLADNTHEGIAARFGGDEFAVLLPNMTRAAATDWAQSLLTQLGQSPILIDQHPHYLSFSFGVSDMRADNAPQLTSSKTALDQLIRQADTRMLSQKA
ncbi:hypothetical protein BZG82_14570 [Salinivibrio sp. PR5]|uniref:GGDEF domain-containing protein n=1 Tax=Salinivibrio sp. PR5 TaxID=1909484 RepID=UPI00098B2DD1|nr:GGDEF domain-containing protein [Salinivibrio sp. PR5]OOF08394.1 hypothetical protein BZG82_14570 [Salinivibrio sp. PR5]